MGMNGETHESKTIGGRVSQDGHAEGILCYEEVFDSCGSSKYDLQGQVH